MDPMGVPAWAAEIRDWLLELQWEIQRHTRAAMQTQDAEALARVARESIGDTIYSLDEELDQVVARACSRLGERHTFVLIAEGDTRVYPAGRSEGEAAFRLIMDPLDGTRGIMYDKRSAWSLAGAAPNLGPDTTLADIVVAVQTEVPTSKQGLIDTVWAIRGEGAHAFRRPVAGGAASPLALRPSQASDLAHGFAMLSKFFPGRKAIVAEIEERLLERLEGSLTKGRVRVFDDQYICTGGQLYELMAGHDRFNGDIRAALQDAPSLPGYAPGLTVHPYDICTELIARELGVIVTDLRGQPLRAHLVEDEPVSWLGYANVMLRGEIEPILLALFQEYGLTANA